MMNSKQDYKILSIQILSINKYGAYAMPVAFGIQVYVFAIFSSWKDEITRNSLRGTPRHFIAGTTTKPWRQQGAQSDLSLNRHGHI